MSVSLSAGAGFILFGVFLLFLSMPGGAEITSDLLGRSVRVWRTNQKLTLITFGIILFGTGLFLVSKESPPQPIATPTPVITFIPSATLTTASTETPTLTPTQTILVNLSPTSTASQTPDITEIISTPTPNYPAILDLCSEKVKAPCIYKVTKTGDSYSNIALAVYGDYFKASTLMLFNRDSSGKVLTLQKGFEVVCHSLDNLPPLPYPTCQTNGIFPCQYISKKDDTFSKVARTFYGDEIYRKILQDQNYIFGLTQTEIDSGFIPESTVIIIPIKP